MQDTIAIQDTIRGDTAVIANDSAAFTAAVRYEGKEVPAFPQNESWIFGTLLFFFVFMALLFRRFSGWIGETLKNIFKVRTRSSIFSKSAAEESRSKFLFIMLSAGIISLSLYIRMTPVPPELRTYLVFYAAGLIYLLVKDFLINLTGYVFLEAEAFKTAKESYYNIFIFLGFILFPVLILKIYFNNGNQAGIFDIFATTITVVALLFVGFKLFQIFYQKILDFFYIILYLCTLEILPLIGMYQVYKSLILEF